MIPDAAATRAAMRTELESYLALYEPTYESAITAERERVALTLRQQGLTPDAIRHFLQHDQEATIRMEANALEAMLVNTGMTMRDLTRMCIEVTYRMHQYDLWRFSEQEYASLRDWAHHALSAFISADYLDRFVNAVEYMLAPIDHLNITHPDTGNRITGLDVLRRADILQLKERTYAFKVGTDAQRRQLVQMLYDRAPYGDMKALHREIVNSDTPAPLGEDDENSESIPQNNPSTSHRTKIRMVYQWDGRGWKLSIPDYVSDAQISLIQSALGDALDVSFVGGYHV